jgi:photosystem II stability/assembly factor-like uncharacterized protein
MDPDDSNSLLAATTNGIYRTTNSGSTWTQVLTGSFRDIIANPNAASNTFYACTGSVIYKSTNNGASFASVTTISGSNRIALAVTPANTDYVYALSSKSSDNGFNGLYKSTNSGTSFAVQSTTPNVLNYSEIGTGTGGQGWYDLCIAASPTNAETIYIGGVNIWKSTNGGVNWTLNAFWYGISGVAEVHADKHAFGWQTPTKLWSCNDGGVYFTENEGTTWTDRSSGIIASQMYRLGVSQSDAKVITGLQDNGTKLRSTSGVWSDILGGDGMECLIHPTNASIMYGCIQYGELHRSTNGGSSWTNIKDNIDPNLSGSWITPYVLDPQTPATIYAAYANLYKSTNQGNTWTVIGPTSAIGTGNKTILEISKSNPSTIYVGTSGSIYTTTNGGTSWRRIPLPGTISSLEIHPTKPKTLWVTLSNYTSGNKIFKTIDGGFTWVNISGTLPNVPFNHVVHNDDLSESVYIAGDVGVFYINNDLTDWQAFSTNLPNVEVFELEIDYAEDKLFAATYGRGLWSSDLNIPSIPTCQAPIDLTATSGYKSVQFSWTAPPILPLGYEYAVNTSATPPTSGTAATGTSVNLVNLAHNTLLYIHVRSTCTSSNSIWKTVSIKTALSCGDTYTDSGGTSNSYANNENIITRICPQAAGFTTLVPFTAFSTESNYDGLYLYSGNTVTTPIIPSNAGTLTSGYPPGAYHGTSSPGTVLSTHISGCITGHFVSDNTTTSTGWNTSAITCATACNNVVLNNNDSGPGSLREAMSCALTYNNITFDNALQGQTINLTSGPLSVTTNLNMMSTPGNNAKITSSLGPILTIPSGISVQIQNVEFTTTSTNTNRVIVNNGNLMLRDVTFIDANAGSIGSTIANSGTLNINQTVVVKKQ